MDVPASRPPDWIVDALFGTGVALALALIVAAAQSLTGAVDLPLAYAFAVGFGGLVLARRRWPRTVLAVSVIGMFAYYTLDLPMIGVAIPVMAALFAAADAGHTVAAIASGVVVFLVSFGFRLRNGEPVALLVGYETVSNLALLAAAIGLGWGVRARRVGAERQREIAELIAERVERDAEARLQRVRVSLSQDLHDGVGHTMSVIALDAAAARESLQRGDADVAAALDRIRTAAIRTLGELRTVVRSLRSDAGEAPVLRSLTALPDLVAGIEATGVVVDLAVEVSPADVSPQVDTVAFRVLQESLTNVLRHSDARRVCVAARMIDGHLRLRVSDDGAGPRGGAEGHGLVGMRERVRVLGGRLEVHGSPGAGVTVEALLPARLS